jgi:hypothetical protein
MAMDACTLLDSWADASRTAQSAVLGFQPVVFLVQLLIFIDKRIDNRLIPL